ncbi:MAG TPA: hypothetical protein VH040_13260 [Usitatibacter sp.]|jgi:hypothetical protein|nr:hypothetical protein [Usitatibacter sp.]
MKAFAITMGAVLAAAAATASADVYYGDRAYYSPEPTLNSNLECWNPHARHFEQVRPGERQDDLDKNNCRNMAPAIAYDPVPVAPAPARYYDRRAYSGDECWNPHAGHFEQVRPGERQDDLDFSRCRPEGYRYAYRYR